MRMLHFFSSPLLWVCMVPFLVSLVSGWGPYSHAAFGSLYFMDLSSLHCCCQPSSLCTTSKRLLRTVGGRFDNGETKQKPLRRHCHKESSSSLLLEAIFVSANSFPDAFKYTYPWMHSFEFAAFQLERAALWTIQNKTISQMVVVDDDDDKSSTTTTKKLSSRLRNFWNNSLDFILTDAIKAYSYGYMQHLFQDYVGHHENSYLNPQKDHLLELDVDTLFYVLHKNDPAPWFYHDNGLATLEQHQDILQQIASFVSETTHQFLPNSTVDDSHDTDKGSGTNGLSIKEADHCIRRFMSLIKMEKIAMLSNSKIYQQGMVHWDVCHAKSFEDANATLRTAMDWTEKAMAVFAEQLFPWTAIDVQPLQVPVGIGKPAKAGAVARTWIEETFENHRGSICNT